MLSEEERQLMLQAKAEGLSKEQALTKLSQFRGGISTPIEKTTLAGRVGGVITSAGERVGEAIRGEGEFAGESPIVRGTEAAFTAAGAIPQVALQSLPGQFGESVRGGLERLGGAVGEQFGKLTQAIGGTELFKGAAGRQEVDPQTGASTYVPNDLGFLEDVLKTTASVGGVAEVVAGAGLTPRAISRTGEAIADVGREAIERTIVAGKDLAEKATPKSARVALRLNPPETRQQAVLELEDAYKTALIEDRKAINNKLDKLAAANSFGDTKVTRDSLIRDLAEEGYIPKIEGQFAKFDEVFDDINTRQRQLMEDLDKELAPLQGIETQTSLDRLRLEAENVLRQSPQVGAGLTSSINELNRMFQSFTEKYGQALNPVDVNNIRKEMNRVTKAYKEQGGEAIFQLDTAEAVAKSTRNRLDEVVPSGRIRQLNQEFARLERVADTAKILNNEIVEVGLIGRKLGSYVGTVGASLAGLSIAGPGGLVIASIAAQLGSDALATMLRSRKFSPELRKAIVENLKTDKPTVDKLIREASPENKAFLKNLLITGGAIEGADFFLSEDDASLASAFLIGSVGRTPITGKALDRVEQYIDHVEGVKKVKGQELIDLKADAQLIAEQAKLDKKYLTGGDKLLMTGLRQALDKQNFEKK